MLRGDTVVAPKTVNTCAHCGAGRVRVRVGSNFFCCDGCSRVYTMLAEQNLLGYYEMLDAAPQTLSGKPREDFAYTDTLWFRKTFTTPLSNDRYQMRLKLPAIHCAACVWLLEKLPEMLHGVLSARINYLRKELTVNASNALPVAGLVGFIADLGYPPDFKPEGARTKALTQYDKGLIKRMAVAAFGFGNAMFFSLPEYLSHNLERGFQVLFLSLNVSLALLVLFYSAGEFFVNAYRALKKKKIILDFPIALGIVAMFARSVSEILGGVSSGYFDTFAGLIFFLLIGRYVQSRSHAHLSFERDNLLFLPLAVRVQGKGGKEKITPVQEIRPKETIRLLHGEIVPTRARVLSEKMSVDYSFITGESMPVILTRGSVVETGAKVVGHSALLEVIEGVDQARVNRIWENASGESTSTPFNEEASFADKVLPYFTFIILALAFLGAVYYLPTDAARSWNAFTAVLVIACPCALAMAKPFSFYTALSVLGRAGLYLKSAASIEKFFGVRRIVFDKTGTITSAEAYDVEYNGKKLSDADIQSIQSIAHESTHPLSRAIDTHWGENSLGIVNNYKEETGMGISGVVDGVPYFLGSLAHLSQQGVVTGSIPSFDAQSIVHVARGKKYLGAFHILNRTRKDLKETLCALSSRFALTLLSGDGEREKARFMEIFPKNTDFYFNASPSQKEEIIRGYEKTARTLMLGDGLNDAKALRAATVGIALSEKQANFSPASDAILDANAFSKLPRLLSEAKQAKKTVIFAYAISFAYNIFGIGVALTGNLTPLFCAILMPISSLSVIGFTYFTTRLTARLRRLY
ncbi:MAG: Copper-exporting P-type ATPase [Turneriella sp.]|nr:Copper-exporting P-type ATPase [Turneriella sp.]